MATFLISKLNVLREKDDSEVFSTLSSDLMKLWTIEYNYWNVDEKFSFCFYFFSFNVDGG